VTVSLVTIEFGSAREEWTPILELADEPIPLRRCLHDGSLFGVVEPETGRHIAATMVIEHGDATAELRAVAVAESEQGSGRGSWMVSKICEHLRAAGARRVIVGTASSGTRQLAFYQRLGFRVSRVERDYFTTDRGYPPGLSENGIPTLDMIWMEQPL
jgi:ribosomal protein S18 acetylase RimI-like enzyme